MGNDTWDQAKVYHLSYNGEPVTVKVAGDGDDALVARGRWTSEEMRRVRSGGPDHVHVWKLRSGDFRLHDMYISASMFPNIRDDRTNRPSPQQEALHASLLRDAQALANGPIDRDSVAKAKELDRQWRASGRAAPANHHAFRAAMDSIFEANRRHISGRNIGTISTITTTTARRGRR